MYSHVPRNVVTDALIHIRDLYRRIRSTNDQALRAHARREATIRDLLSNLPRTNEHPTLKTVLDVADACGLTLERAHRLAEAWRAVSSAAMKRSICCFN